MEPYTDNQASFIKTLIEKAGGQTTTLPEPAATSCRQVQSGEVISKKAAGRLITALEELLDSTGIEPLKRVTEKQVWLLTKLYNELQHVISDTHWVRVHFPIEPTLKRRTASQIIEALKKIEENPPLPSDDDIPFPALSDTEGIPNFPQSDGEIF